MIFRSELSGLKRIVVKVGTNAITKKSGKLDTRKIRKIVEDISDLVDQGIEVILVSSGAVALGKAFLNKYMPEADKIQLMHSASSVGQPKLINTYSRIFEENQKLCSQILLTHDDFRDRKRFLHTKANVSVLLRNKITPILNENDSISYTEITVGDNDHLAVQTAQMVNADLLLVITSTDGLFDKDPAKEGAKKIDRVTLSCDLSSVNFQGKTSVGRGGMESKVQAISKITPLGIKAIVSSKDAERIIVDPLTKKIGTYFSPQNKYDPEDRKAWMLSTKKPNCFIEIDETAYLKLCQNKPLQPEGIIQVEGDFYQGDCIDIRYKNQLFATGICEYGNDEISQIMGYSSDDIQNILGYQNSNQVVHHLNLVINKEGFEDERISKTS